jgi:hypothetical protein
MRFESEYKIIVDRKKSLLEKYIDSCSTGNIENLIIKEEWIMLEQLREKYVAQLEEMKAQDIEVLVKEELDKVVEQIRAEVVANHEKNIVLAELKVKAVDEMINDECSTDEQENENMEG